jgi:hypothetical protein
MHDRCRDEKKVGQTVGDMTLYTRWRKESGIAYTQKLLNAAKRCVIASGQAASYQANPSAKRVRGKDFAALEAFTIQLL